MTTCPDKVHLYMTKHYRNFSDLNRRADLTKLSGMPQLSIVSRSAKFGKELHGPCPFCGDGTDRFWVNIEKSPMTFTCRRCGVHGNAMDFIALREGLSIITDGPKVAEILAREIGDCDRKSPQYYANFDQKSEPSFKPNPPDNNWQSDLIKILDRASKRLFEPVGMNAMDFLHNRGISDRSIRSYRIGFIPFDCKWNGYSLYSGITIPTFINDDLYRVRIRRINQQATPKYLNIAGSDGHSLFNADEVLLYPDIVFVEGEFDAIIINQILSAAGNNRIRAATFGSAQVRPSVDRYYRYFRIPSRIIVAYDNDPAGTIGSEALCNTINKVLTRPYPAIVKQLPTGINDWTDYYLAGGNITESLQSWFVELLSPSQSKGIISD